MFLDAAVNMIAMCFACFFKKRLKLIASGQGGKSVKGDNYTNTKPQVL